jgi:hypothetical protein
LRLNFEAQVGRELRPIQISQIYKEKEMNFRRCITALAVLALFAGLASAQVYSSTAGAGGSFTCQANVAVPTFMRAEGMTELIGDIVLTCTGGGSQPVIPAIGGTQVALPTANVTVSFGQTVTSRLMSVAVSNPNLAQSNTSEALLLIDEPGSGFQMGGNNIAGFGPNAQQYLCGASGPGVAGTPSSAIGAGVGGCQEFAQYWSGDFVMSTTAVVPAGAPAAAPNMFAGVSVANQVTFYGIPILPPASSSVARVFRITNVRLNANAYGNAGPAGTTPVTASISIQGNTSVLVNGPTPIVGFIETGLNTKLQNTSNTGNGGSSTFQQCSGQTLNGFNIMRFTENFGTAFKTRVAPTLTTGGQTATPSPMQNVPAVIYNSESGFITPLITSNQYGMTAGLADFGTRLKAVFTNVPTNVNIFVSTSNVNNLFTTVAPSGMVTNPGFNSATSWAQLVLSENGAEGNTVVPTSFIQAGAVNTSLGYSQVNIGPTGTGTAVWEVMNTNPATPENFDFAVWVSYSSNPGANQPTPTGSAPATVTLSYAPTSTQGAFSASSAITASGNLPIPRFSDASAQAAGLFTIVPCTTNLLFPFITGAPTWDTGIAIMNTGQDPWGTSTQHGVCAFSWYGTNVPVVPNSPDIPAGQNYTMLSSVVAPNFQGYMIAVCQFQFAHGYAFISDLGTQKFAQGYLALVLTNGTGKRSANETLMH